MPRALRVTLLLLAILATVAVASASVLPAHLHARVPATDCELCCVAHAVAQEARPVIPAAPVPLTREHSPESGPTAGYQSVVPTAGLTRGPPSSF